MTDELRPRPHWTDERLTDKFAEIKGSIDETRRQQARENDVLKADFDDKHKMNQADILELRRGQSRMQETLGSIDAKSSKSLLLLTQAVGENGEPGKGRLGAAEHAIEVLKKFRWQLIAGLSVVVTILKMLKII
jgi:hypothetical protein